MVSRPHGTTLGAAVLFGAVLFHFLLGITTVDAAAVQLQLSGAVSVTAGLYHTCASLTDGTARCWGYNNFGQLGDGSLTDRQSPVAVEGLHGVASISAGDYFTCARHSAGTVSCFGMNTAAQLGDGTTTARKLPVPVTGLTGVTSLSCDAQHCCAATGGAAKCWGSNVYSQTGMPASSYQALPVAVPGLTEVVKVAAGGRHSCAALSSGAVACFGSNKAGQLGDGTTTDSQMPVTVNSQGRLLLLEPSLHTLTAGNYHTCAIWSDGSVSCWGSNLYGQLGGDTKVKFSTVPVQVPGVTDAVWISAGDYHTCVATKSGKALCFGMNLSGKLGDGSAEDAFAPVQVLGLDNVATIAAGGDHTCATLAPGLVSCWGDNLYYQLGDGTSRRVPIKVPGITGAVAISAQSEHSCAVLATGAAVCFGDGSHGERGDNTTDNIPTPIPVAIVSNVKVVAAGAEHSAAILGDGTVWVWGDNQAGQLGDGTRIERHTPVPASGLTGAAISTEKQTLAPGEFHTCVLMADGSVKCMGANTEGQLGDGTFQDRLTAVQVAGLADAVSVTAGYIHTCALLAVGSVACWGSNSYGQLGDGSKVNRNRPTPVQGLQNVRQISAGHLHTCAVHSLDVDGPPVVSCWGANNKAQLAMEPSTVSMLLTPSAQVPDLPGVKGIAAGNGHTCAVLDSGIVRCWGDSEQAQLGNGVVTDAQYLPVTVAGLTDVQAIAAGDAHSCALVKDGGIFCWGENDEGQLGRITLPVSISAEEASHPYTECRQVIAPDGLNAFSQPGGKGSIKAAFSRCDRVELIVPAAGAAAGVKGDGNSCWMELMLQQRRGLWVQVADDCSSSTILAMCGTHSCAPVAPKPTSCFQVVGLQAPAVLHSAPCEAARAVMETPLQRGEQVVVVNMNSQQTSACGAAPRPGTLTLATCWIEATFESQALHGEPLILTGFLPISRETRPGGFMNAFCDHVAPDEEFIEPCASKITNVECRQAITKTLPVYYKPCSSQVVASIQRCQKFDFVLGSNTRTRCPGDAQDHEWLQVRFVDEEGSQELGWVDAGAAELGDKVEACPSTACEAIEAPEWDCHMVHKFPVPGVTLFREPCFDQSLRLSSQDLQPFQAYESYGPASKQTTKCADKNSDDFCWRKARATLEGQQITGWLPVSRPSPGSRYVNSFCGVTSGEDEFVLQFCDYCAGVSCPASDQCHTPSLCDPRTGKCGRGNLPEPAGTPCSVPCTSSPTRRCPGACINEGQCMPMATRPAQKALPSTVFAHGANSAPCPSLQCLNGLDLANWKMGGKLGHFGSAKLASGLPVTDMLPISMLASLNQMFIGLDRQDSRARCAVPVKSGAELLRFKPHQASRDFVHLVNKRQVAISQTDALANIADMYKACNNLPVPKGSELASQDYVWGVAGAMTNDAIARRVTRSYQWFNAADTGKQLGGMMLRQPGFAACAALNPCAGDFLYAFNALDASIDLADLSLSQQPQQRLVMRAAQHKARVEQIGLSTQGRFSTEAEAWKPFSSLGDAESDDGDVGEGLMQTRQQYAVHGNVVISTVSDATLSLSALVPEKIYLPDEEDDKTTLKLEVDVRYQGRLTLGDGPDGWTLLVEGSSAYPSVSLGGFFATPHTFDTAPKPMTMYVHQKSGPSIEMWLRHGARVRLASLLRSMPFGENMALLVDGYNQVPVETVNGFEAHYQAVEGGGIRSALIARLPFSQGMDLLAAQLGETLSSLPYGTNLWLAAAAEDNANGEYEASISFWTANHDGATSHQGRTILTCASVEVQAKASAKSGIDPSRLVPAFCKDSVR